MIEFSLVLTEPCGHSHHEHTHEDATHSISKKSKSEQHQDIQLLGEFFSSHFGRENIEVDLAAQTITVNADGDSALIELENNVILDSLLVDFKIFLVRFL